VQPGQSNKKSRTLLVVAVLVVVGVVALAAVNGARNWSATAAARKLKNPVPATSDSLAAGQQLYREHCERCHGEKGDGKGEKAYELSVAPGDFTDVQKMGRVTDGELFWQITRGRLPMPSFETKVSEEGRWQLVDYIRTFAAKSAGSSSTAPTQ
jgi:mono/diheme cytochrome c family protein